MRWLDDDKFREWTLLAASGQMVGAKRPIGRVTLGENKQKSVRSTRPGPWRFVQFQHGDDVELPGIRSIDINRGLDQDAATCTIVVSNAAPTVNTSDEDHYIDDGRLASWANGSGYGRPGWMSPSRGSSHKNALNSIYSKYLDDLGVDLSEQSLKDRYLTRWGFGRNEWFRKLIPNRLIRTYQGFGSDNFDDDNELLWPGDPGYVAPWSDEQLVVTGTWLIDTIELNADMTITLTCRDLGKLLLEQVVYPPMIPLQRFPLQYCPAHKKKGHHGRKPQASKNRIKYHSAAVNLHPRYRDGVYGHKPEHAFDGRPDSYFLSHSYSSASATSTKEWIQGQCGGDKINTVTIHTVKEGYTVYVSVFEDGEWKGSDDIPYSTGDYGHSHGAGIKYVAKHTMGSSKTKIKLPRTYKAKFVRFTFTNLRDWDLSPLPYRVGVKNLTAYMQQDGRKDTFIPSTVNKPGYITDWSEVIKELVGWAGFTWKTDTSLRGFDDPKSVKADPLLGKQILQQVGGHKPGSPQAILLGQPLRVWGDIEDLGTGPIECTPSDYFLNKSFMECCKMVADFLGCLFFIDEYGGVIFRFPNLWSGGNFMTDPEGPSEAVRTDSPTVYKRRRWPIELHESANLMSYSVTLDDSQVRSEILVVGTNPDTNSNAVLAGGIRLVDTQNGAESRSVDFTEVLAGQQRLFLVPGEQTKGFKTVEECQRMAELIGVKILFSYRKATAHITGHPGLQLDDQVRIFERTTHENNIHYVSAISSHMDCETGEYTMDVTTHWLGSDPDRDWFLKYVRITPAIKQIPAILRRLGRANPGSEGPK